MQVQSTGKLKEDDVTSMTGNSQPCDEAASSVSSRSRGAAPDGSELVPERCCLFQNLWRFTVLSVPLTVIFSQRLFVDR